MRNPLKTGILSANKKNRPLILLTYYNFTNSYQADAHYQEEMHSYHLSFQLLRLCFPQKRPVISLQVTYHILPSELLVHQNICCWRPDAGSVTASVFFICILAVSVNCWSSSRRTPQVAVAAIFSLFACLLPAFQEEGSANVRITAHVRRTCLGQAAYTGAKSQVFTLFN